MYMASVATLLTMLSEVEVDIDKVVNMKFFEKRIDDNCIGCWYHYYLFGKKIYTKLIHLYKYV